MKAHTQAFFAILAVACCRLNFSQSPDASTMAVAFPSNKARESFGSIPLHFEENVGQAESSVRYLTRGPGYAMALRSTDAKVMLFRQAQGRAVSVQGVVSVRLTGGNPAAEIEALEEMPGRVNQFIGSDRSQWRTNIQTFRRVKYQKVYPGIDLVYYGNQRELEYDFIVSPHADPSMIRLSFEGVDEVALNSSGDLILRVEDAVLKHRRPILYQERNGERVAIDGRFVKHASNEVGFEVGAYDRGQPLVIDPILEYSTYLGSGAGDGITGMDVDAGGNVVVVGYTGSLNDFPFANAYLDDTAQRIEGGNAFVTRLSPTGTLIYSTYLGGEDHEEAAAVALDNASNAYVTGMTRSIPGFGKQGFPVTVGAYMTTFRSFSTAFVTKLSAGGGLVYSTFLHTDLSGGAYSGVDIDVDGEGFAYVASNKGGSQFYVTKVNQFGTALVYHQEVLNAVAAGIAVDAMGAAHIAGNTVSGSMSQFFQTTPTAYETNTSSFQLSRAFYLKLDATGTNRVYSTLFASRNDSTAGGVAVDALGRAYVAGSVRAPGNPSRLQYGDFRTKNGFQTEFGGGLTDAYVARFDPNLAGTNSLLYASYLGGSHDESGLAVRVDEIGQAYVAGATTSTNFPLASAVQTNYAGGRSDGFIAQINAGGSGLVFSTYIGGFGQDSANAIAVGLTGMNVYVAGTTDSTDFPVLNAIFPSSKGFTEGFTARYRMVEPQLTFTVNTADDVDDGTCDSVHCSLREAIKAANAATGKQTIEFNIPGEGIPGIYPKTNLPAITDPVVVDGTSQPESHLVHLSGLDAGLAATHGLVLQGGMSEIKGLSIGRWAGSGIYIDGKGGNRIAGNFIGVTRQGVGAMNRTGVHIFDSTNNIIGGSSAAERNVISGNDTYGIVLGAGAIGNEILGNIIGADPSGSKAVRNFSGGIYVAAPGNRIGGETGTPGTPPGNQISGHESARSAGIRIEDVTGTGTVISGNVIGTTLNGTAALANFSGIVLLRSSQTVVGGAEIGLRNVISGNLSYGIEIQSGANETEVFGNIIGGDLAGMTAIPNGMGGIIVESYGNRIGGEITAPGSSVGAPPGNLISGHFNAGAAAVRIQGSEGVFGNAIQGNLIGTTMSGDSIMANTYGVVIQDARDTIIGGSSASFRNVISGNRFDGILITGRTALENRIQGNYIGASASGGFKIPNGGSGISVTNSTIIGGAATQPGLPPGNVISGNAAAGITISGSDNVVQGNAIGVNHDVSYALGNEREGILIDARNRNTFENLIGGRMAGQGNVIGGNTRDGILMNGPATADTGILLENRIEGNFIGTSQTGSALPNGMDGVAIVDVSANMVGGNVPEAANRIHFNAESGVRIGGFFGKRNSISGNSIKGNGSLGIDLGVVGVTANDAMDEDDGANQLQNFLESIRAIDAGDSILVRGYLDAPFKRPYLIEYFGNSVCDSTTTRSGELFLDRHVFARFDMTKAAMLLYLPKPAGFQGSYITTTVTDPDGNTSEFSACATIAPVLDTDGDGVDDFVEETGPNNGDANRDGSLDKNQGSIGTGYSVTSQAYITAEAPPNYIIKNLAFPPFLQNLAIFLAKWQFALDFFRMQIELSAPPGNFRGSAASGNVPVVFYLPAGANVNTCLLFGPTPDNATPHWYEFLFDGTTGAIFENGKATLHFVDGQRGDHDLVANGKIETAGGFALGGNLPIEITDFSRFGVNQDYLRVAAAAGRSYSIQTSSDLKNWEIVGARASATGVFDFLHTVSNGENVQFYRVREEQ